MTELAERGPEAAVAGASSPAEVERIDEAVRFINQRTAAAGIELAREVGAYVLETFFGGDFEAFSDPRRTKPLSFRRLQERQDLLLPASTLYTFVRVARQLAELPAETAERLTVSHHRALLPVKDPDEKAALARRALDEGWSKVELERTVRARLPRSPRGRKRLPACVKAAPRIARALEEALAEVTPPEDLRRVGDARLRATLEQIEESLVRLQWLQATLQEALEGDGGS